MSVKCPILRVGRADSAQPEGFKNSTLTWKGKRTFGRTVCVDFDGVIAGMQKGWRGPNKFGPVIDGAPQTLLTLKQHGWYIVIFTTRLVTQQLIKYLNDNRVFYDDINGRCFVKNGDLYVRLQRYNRSTVDFKAAHPRFYWRHNPEWSSIKPIASVYLDDHGWPIKGDFTVEVWNQVAKDLVNGKY